VRRARWTEQRLSVLRLYLSFGFISTEFKGRRFVVVGGKLYNSHRWATFHDFLMDYGRGVLGREWWLQEATKPADQRHPIVKWFDLAQQSLEPTSSAEPVRSRPMTGAMAAYLYLAYDLFSLEHNAEVRARLVQRLKDPDNFEGAHYEVYVGAAFSRAGYQLTFEDEDDRTRSHCEFTATNKESGRSFSVEAKHRTWGQGQDPTSGRQRIGRKLDEALRKHANHPRVVFIDVNVPDDAKNEGVPSFMLRALDQARRFERSPRGRNLPPVYLFLTNRPYHHDLGGTNHRRSVIAEGFHIAEFKGHGTFATLRQAVEARDAHIDMHRLVDSIAKHNEVPATFDGESPELAFGRNPDRLIIGHRYLVPGGGALEVPGTLESAAVMEREQLAYGVYALDDGQRITATVPLADAEIAAYRRHPDTFFGVVQPVSKQISGPLDLFDFFYTSYRETPRERLLEFLATAPDVEELEKLSQPELAKTLAERYVYGTLQRSQAPGTIEQPMPTTAK
jgi:hypothetical protein